MYVKTDQKQTAMCLISLAATLSMAPNFAAMWFNTIFYHWHANTAVNYDALVHIWYTYSDHLP